MSISAQIPTIPLTPPRVQNKSLHRYMINIGSGISGAPGWYNIDNSPTIPLSRIPLVRRISRIPAWPADVHRHDVRKGLPFPDKSVSYVYSSHTFEHFSWSESLAIARECFRVLEPGGVFRVAVPDLGLMVREYLQNGSAMASHEFLQRLSLNHGVSDLVHPGANHSQMFDEKSLLYLFRQAGFISPEVKDFMQSGIPYISKVELEVRRRESLYVEARR
jgi:SAM-dependent methyltransferase